MARLSFEDAKIILINSWCCCKPDPWPLSLIFRSFSDSSRGTVWCAKSYSRWDDSSNSAETELWISELIKIRITFTLQLHAGDMYLWAYLPHASWFKPPAYTTLIWNFPFRITIYRSGKINRTRQTTIIMYDTSNETHYIPQLTKLQSQK